MLKKDLRWTTTNGKSYVIRNVPYEEIDAEGEEFIDLGVAFKLEIIGVLMFEDRIPHDVDFEVVKDMELELQ